MRETVFDYTDFNSKLKRCPFCGGKAIFRDGTSTRPYVRCMSCGCRTGSTDYSTPQKLVAKWNRRHEDGQD